jgi:hypothetical protein
MHQYDSASRPRGSRAAALIAIPASLLLTAGLAQAATLMAYTGVQAYTANDEPLYDGNEESICSSYSDTGSVNECQGNWSGLEYHTFSSAEYGVLKVYGAQSVGGLTDNGGLSETPYYVSAIGSAGFRDQWTIYGEPTGTTGTLQLSFNITGSFDYATANTGVTVGLGMFVFGSGPAQSDPSYVPVSGGIGTLDYTHTFTTQFTYGVPIDFQIFLTGGSVLYGLDSDDTFRSSMFDLSNTAVMNAVIVKDTIGNEVSFAIETASSAALFYELAPQAAVVPVPAAVWLLGSGLVGLLGLRRRQAIN